jgi:hypothetical protein
MLNYKKTIMKNFKKLGLIGQYIAIAFFYIAVATIAFVVPIYFVFTNEVLYVLGVLSLIKYLASE